MTGENNNLKKNFKRYKSTAGLPNISFSETGRTDKRQKRLNSDRASLLISVKLLSFLCMMVEPTE